MKTSAYQCVNIIFSSLKYFAIEIYGENYWSAHITKKVTNKGKLIASIELGYFTLSNCVIPPHSNSHPEIRPPPKKRLTY